MDELSSLRDVMSRNIIVFEKGTITSEIVKTCISKLNSGKDDGDIGFKSDHIINGTYRLNVLTSLLFNTMISHGYTPTVLSKSTIVSIPKITRLLSRTLIIIEGYLFLIQLINYLTTLFYIYIKINFNQLICNLDIKKDTLQCCGFWFIKKLLLIMLTIIQVYIVVC